MSNREAPVQYAELHAHSAYTFLEGVDLPRALVNRAANIGLSALGILDVDGMYSAVQTATAAELVGLPCVFGAELTLETGNKGWGLPTGSADLGVRLPVLVRGQGGYHSLCAAISEHNLSNPGVRHGKWLLEELSAKHGDWVILTGTAHGPLRRAFVSGGMEAARRERDRLIEYFGAEAVAIETNLRTDSDDELAEALNELAKERGLRLVATGAVRCSDAVRQPLADVMTASRLNVELDAARGHLPPFGSFLRRADEMLRIHHRFPHAVAASAELASEITFDLKLIAPKLPQSDVPDGHTDASWLRHLTFEGALQRYGTRQQNPGAWEVIDNELAVIERLDFPGYFLIVKDIVDFCKRNEIFAQGRGSAANSAVCYALGVTAVDAVKHKLMFERFLSEARKALPDIDIDIESARREEVIQYVYQKYGRDRAAQVANTITYRPRSAVRAAGKALGYGEEIVNSWTKDLVRGGTGTKNLPPLVEKIATALQKLPRHMGIHPGGMVLTAAPVAEICPVMWAAMKDRTVLQWDKEDCADAGLVKFDLLGLGMLTALRKSFTWLSAEGVRGADNNALGLYNLPDEDPRVYDLLCAAESVGVFQVESRAQMGTLPRMQPRKFYDLVVEVALIRPGPIQGQAVNPYLDRRNGNADPYCHPLLKPALEKTLGVPLFQEQLMKVAVDVAGFTPAESDELRRAIGSKHSEERMAALRPKLYAGMEASGLPKEEQDKVYDSLKGFAEFGFPESHSFSFAFLVYASAWLKTYYPEHFYAGILASQPMGFYSPASLIADAKRHGIQVKGVSVQFSKEEAHVEGTGDLETDFEGLIRSHESHAVRLGLEQIKGLSKTKAAKIVKARNRGNFLDLPDFARRVPLTAKDMEQIALAGAFDDLGVSRREALWFAAQLANAKEWQPYLPGTEIGMEKPDLPVMDNTQILETDWRSLGLTTGKHPLELCRESLRADGVITAAQTATIEEGSVVTVAGIVTHRQRPGTARGVTFLSLEDETGLVNVVVSVGAWTKFQTVALTSKGLIVRGRIEKKDRAHSMTAYKIEPLALSVETKSRDFQ